MELPKGAEKRAVVFHSSKSYEQFFKAYRDWCKANSVKAFTKDPAVIARYLVHLSQTAHGGKPRGVSTLRVKVTAIKRHYEVNGVADWIDFKIFGSKFFRDFETSARALIAKV